VQRWLPKLICVNAMFEIERNTHLAYYWVKHCMWGMHFRLINISLNCASTFQFDRAKVSYTCLSSWIPLFLLWKSLQVIVMQLQQAEFKSWLFKQNHDHLSPVRRICVRLKSFVWYICLRTNKVLSWGELISAKKW
jgi:hypothetical protein